MSIENSYEYYNDGICNVPTGYEVTNSYGAYFRLPNTGTRKIAIYGDNFLIGYQGISPPTDGGYIKGRLGIGQSSAVCDLDVAGTVRCTGLITTPEIVTSSTSLSTTQNSIIDSRSSALTVTLADASLVNQVKSVSLISRAALDTTVTCSKGSFKLTSANPTKLLRFSADGWVMENAYSQSISDSFYTTVQSSVFSSSSISETGAFGISVALSSDGLTAIVGGSFASDSVGVGYVLTRSDASSTWTLEQKLSGTGNQGGSQQGNSVAISADGNTVALGGPTDNTNVGATWIFTRSNRVWRQVGSKRVGTGATGAAQQGTAIALSADGTILAVGGPADNTNIGATWIFRYSANDWTQVGSKLVGTGNTGQCRQGYSVALSADASTLVVGGYTDNTNVGAIWIYYGITPSVYAAEASALTGSDVTGAARVGTSVAISADGNTVIAGGGTDNSSAGAAWVFSRTSSTWAQQGLKLVGSSAVGAAQQGNKVAVSSDGNTLASYGYADNSSVGAVWNFVRSNGKWRQQNKLIPTGISTNAGSIALNANGNCLAIASYSFSSYEGKFCFFN